MRSQNFRPIADLIKNNKGRILVLTGAGISAESGIPTFRGRGGLWEKYDPERYANLPGLLAEFKKDPLNISRYLYDFYDCLIKAKPNPAHLALAAMEEKNFLKGIITQNIDNLHQDAGSKKVWEVHGNAFGIRCDSCGSKQKINRENLTQSILRLSQAKSRFQVLREVARIFPQCNCGGRFRTDVVLFGEQLPQEVLSQVSNALETCSLMLVVGTSALVYPAAGIPVIAKENGAMVVEINTERSALSKMCDYSPLGNAGVILPQIWQACLD